MSFVEYSNLVIFKMIPAAQILIHALMNWEVSASPDYVKIQQAQSHQSNFNSLGFRDLASLLRHIKFLTFPQNKNFFKTRKLFIKTHIPEFASFTLEEMNLLISIMREMKSSEKSAYWFHFEERMQSFLESLTSIDGSAVQAFKFCDFLIIFLRDNNSHQYYLHPHYAPLLNSLKLLTCTLSFATAMFCGMIKIVSDHLPNELKRYLSIISDLKSFREHIIYKNFHLGKIEMNLEIDPEFTAQMAIAKLVHFQEKIKNGDKECLSLVLSLTS